ncbi:RHS repeat-associated core domain-containing protein [Burkholderia sp. BCC0405]|uniref:RHS repeat-associated core domain-containing protein n=1 Tax=Burkholderia sp. BCC0405 TaxID=2676298 RepID=UPI001FC86E03|nr:RHS repeat-associated core domain-containing protein [Burkholderia sp. BCC0405]
MGVETFAFDPAGNLLKTTERDDRGLDAVNRQPALLDNLLKDYAGTHYAYDERGNLCERTTHSTKTVFGWDSFNRMVSARTQEMDARYVYDALGRRIAKVTEPRLRAHPMAGSSYAQMERQRLKQAHGYGLTLYGWDGDTLAYETAWEQRMTTHYVYEPGSFTPLLQESGPMAGGDKVPPRLTSVAYYHCDQIGTPQELSDGTGALAWSAHYRAWGEAKEAIGEAARKAGIRNPIRFAGQYFDAETGLHYNRHRYYDPGSGRFVSKDPIGLAGGINVYQYAPNPTGWVDPLGLTGFEPKVLTSGTVFRNASGTPDSLTPRLGKDTTRVDGKEPGLSAATSEAGLDSGKYVELDVGKLCSCGLQATHDKPNGHVTIRPINDPTDSKLTDWAKSRGGGSTHSLTEGILGAVTGRGEK